MVKSRLLNSNNISLAASLGVHALFVALLLFSKPSLLISNPLGTTPLSDTLTYISLQETTHEVSPSSSAHAPAEKIQKEDILTAEKKMTLKETEITTQEQKKSNIISTSINSGDSHGTASTSALSVYLYELRQLIQQKKIYPSLSRKMGETGKVIVTLELLKDGTIRDVKIKDTSPFSRLNQAALATVTQVAKYKPIPDAIDEQQLSVEIPIQFSL